jgi:hypothetical protein
MALTIRFSYVSTPSANNLSIPDLGLGLFFTDTQNHLTVSMLMGERKAFFNANERGEFAHWPCNFSCCILLVAEPCSAYVRPPAISFADLFH